MILFKDQGVKQEDIIKQTWLEEKLEGKKSACCVDNSKKKYFDYNGVTPDCPDNLEKIL
jgi:hypothetical protein